MSTQVPGGEVVPKPRRALGRQLVWVTSGRLLAALMQALLFILAARAMALDDFGHLMAFIGVITLVQVSVDCGVQTYISRERASNPDSGGVTTALRFTAFSSTFLSALLALGLVAAALTIDPIYWVMLPLALWGSGERSADMRLTVAFADGDVHIPILHLVVRRGLTIVLFLAGMAMSGPIGEPVLAFSLASGIAAMGSAFFAYLYIRRRVSAPPSIGFAELLRAARAYWVSNIALQARNLDALLISAFSGASQAGLYSSGSRLASPLQLLPLSLASILLPASARGETSRASLKRLILLTSVVVAGLSVVYAVIFVVTPLVVSQTLGERYDGSTTVIRFILLGLPFSSAATLFSAILQGRGEGRSVAVTTTSSTVVCLVGIAIVAPLAGAAGAAAVLSLSFVVQLAGTSYSMRRLWTTSQT